MINLDIGRIAPLNSPAHVDEVKLYEVEGPHTTKTGSKLFVAYAFPTDPNYKINEPQGISLVDYLKVDSNEEQLIKERIRKKHPNFNESFQGDRLYFQTHIPKGSIAGMEFHRMRKELLIPLTGEIEAEFEDVYGNSKQMMLCEGKSVIIPPFIMHTLNVIKDAAVAVKTNTMYFFMHNGEKITVADSYSMDDFKALQEKIKYK